eukprot:5383022-Amphidinium_carterae.1
MPLQKPEYIGEDICVVASDSEVVEDPAVEGAEVPEEVAEPPEKWTKRQWKAVPQAFKDWLLEYRDHMWKLH